MSMTTSTRMTKGLFAAVILGGTAVVVYVALRQPTRGVGQPLDGEASTKDPSSVSAAFAVELDTQSLAAEPMPSDHAPPGSPTPRAPPQPSRRAPRKQAQPRPNTTIPASEESAEPPGTQSLTAVNGTALAAGQQPNVDRMFAGLTRQLDQEPRDAGWAWGAETDLRQVAESQELGAGRVASVECRTSLCRLDVSFDSPEAYADFLENARVTGRFAAMGTLFIHRESLSDLGLEVFVAREGQGFPAAASE